MWDLCGLMLSRQSTDSPPYVWIVEHLPHHGEGGVGHDVGRDHQRRTHLPRFLPNGDDTDGPEGFIGSGVLTDKSLFEMVISVGFNMTEVLPTVLDHEPDERDLSD